MSNHNKAGAESFSGSLYPSDQDIRERAVIFGPVESGSVFRDESALDELGRLVESAGGEIVGRLVQPVRSIDPATYFGSGKIQELRDLCDQAEADIAVFDRELSPAQGRNIEKALKIRVVDRSELILDIFARRARTNQARMQVELAMLQYKLPRLKRMWTHLDRIHSAIGARGPGETQIETDRRIIRKRIQEYIKKLDVLNSRQHTRILTREDFKISLVGYTNAGKSTLMRALTGAEVYVADQLFATLDTTTRSFKIPEAGKVLLSDTVGFVHHLPHHLVESFHATLAEAMEADLILHVVDAADPMLEEHLDTVESVLKDLGCSEVPVLVVANKMDCDGAPFGLHQLRARYPQVVPVSSVTGKGLELLREEIAEDVRDGWGCYHLQIPFAEGKLHANLRSTGRILDEKVGDDGMLYEVEMRRALYESMNLKRYSLEEDGDE